MLLAIKVRQMLVVQWSIVETILTCHPRQPREAISVWSMIYSVNLRDVWAGSMEPNSLEIMIANKRKLSDR